MIVQVHGYRIRPFDAGWVLERCAPAHERDGKEVPERWRCECYPHTLEHALLLMQERLVRGHPAEALSIAEAVEVWRELQADLVAAATATNGRTD